MRDSILFFMLTHRTKYFPRFYSVVLFLIVPFVAWFSLLMLAPSPGLFTATLTLNLLILASLLCLFVLFLSVYATIDCRRDVFFIRIDDVVTARTFYALITLLLGVVASTAGYCLDLSYFAFVMFFALRDFHPKRSKYYLLASVVICLICTASRVSEFSGELLVASAQNWLTQWLMAACVYCALDCISQNSERLTNADLSIDQKPLSSKSTINYDLTSFFRFLTTNVFGGNIIKRSRGNLIKKMR